MLTRNQNINEINSISANVRVSPMPQPPSYDFATKNLEPIGNETLPPSYDSIQTRVQTVRRNFRLTVQNNAFPERYVNKPFGQKVVYIFLVLLFLAYFVLLPLFKIIIGLNSINECPLNTSIPYWLMIDGVFIVLLALSIFLFKYFDCSLMASVISLFLFSWLIRGSVWVYKAGDSVSFDPDDTQNYCDPVCFHFAFWSISVTWSIIGFIILFIIFVIVIQSCKK